MYHSAVDVFRSRVDAALPVVLIFYRGERSFFCKQWLRRWLSIRGLAPRLRQLDVILMLISSQSQGKAFSVADQLVSARTDLHSHVLFFGDPDNTLVHYLRANAMPSPVVTNPQLHRAHGWLFEHGMVQPAVLAIFPHAVLYQWCSRPSFLNGAGKLDRPDPWHVWDSIESEMERVVKQRTSSIHPPLQSPSETSHRSAYAPLPSDSPTVDAPQSPILSELKSTAAHPLHIVEAKMLPTPSTLHTHSSEQSSSPEQLGATIRRLSSTLNALSSDTPNRSSHAHQTELARLPQILEHVLCNPAVIAAPLESKQPQSPSPNELPLQSSSWYDRRDTELNASQRKLHQFNAEHTATSESAAWDRLQLFGRIQGSQSSLQSSASSEYKSTEPVLTSPDKLDRPFSTNALNDEYTSSDVDVLSAKDMRETQDSDEHHYSQLFARVSALERQSTNRSFRSLLNTESQGPSSSDCREPLEGSNTSLGSDVVDSLIRKARSVRTSDSNLMNQLREGISFPSMRIDEEGENLEASVFDLLKELSDQLNLQDKLHSNGNSKKSMKSSVVRAESFDASTRADVGMLSSERSSSVDAAPITFTSFRNVPRVGIRDYSANASKVPLPVRRDRTTKGIIPEVGDTQQGVIGTSSLVCDEVGTILTPHHSQSDLGRTAASLQSDVSGDVGTAPLDVERAHNWDERRSETRIHDEYEAYDEFLVAEYEVEERMEERQSGSCKTGSQRERPQSIGAQHVWVEEERELLRPIKSDTSPLDNALGKFNSSRRAEGGVRGALGRLRRSVRYEEGERPRRLDSLKAMLLGRGRAMGAADGDDVVRLASGPVGGATGDGADGMMRGDMGRGGLSRGMAKWNRTEKRWWGKRREGDAQRERGLVVTASMAALLRSRRKVR